VWLKIDNRGGKLKVGAPVKVAINGRSVANAMKIPQSAVLTGDDGSKSVMIVGSDNTAVKKKVTLGITNGDDVQVLSGLDGSEQVITTGSYGIDPGTKVKIGKVGDDADGKPARADRGGNDK